MTTRPQPRRWQVLSAVCAGVFLAAIDFYIVTVAVPDMLREFSHTGIAEISWVFNGYTITFTTALLPAGGLADRFGRRKIFMIGIAAFSLSALVCATAPTAAVLIAARLVQGLAGGTITPLALALILPEFPAERRGYAIGLWSATQSAAVAAGPSLGGILVSAIGWRAVFLLQLPIGLVALAGTAWRVPRDHINQTISAGGPRAAPGRPQPVDLIGLLLLAPGIALPSLAIVQSHAWGILNWRTDITLIGGLLLAAAFVRRSLRHRAPIVDLRLLGIPAVRRANLVMLLTGLVMYVLTAAAVLFLTGVWGYSEARAGLAVTPGPVMQAAGALGGGRLVGRYGPRAVAVPGAIGLAASTLAFAVATGARSRYWAVVFPAVLGSGAAIGLLVTSLSAAVIREVPAARLASGTAISGVARAVGAVVSLSGLALALAAVPDGTSSVRAYHLAWTAMAVISVAVLMSSFSIGKANIATESFAD
jgi:EmrB/QacA subfamily drug resistance transporter